MAEHQTDGTISGILVLYHRPVIESSPLYMQHICSFEQYSRFPVWAVNTLYGFPPALKLMKFRVVVLHYTLFASYPFRMAQAFIRFLEKAGDSLKVAFFHDEMRHCKERNRFINQTGVESIYTPLESEYHERVYLSSTSCKRVYHTLTGYVDDEMVELAGSLYQPPGERIRDVGYRVRSLPWHMGKGAREKTQIAEEFSSRLAGTKLVIDIKTGADDLISGNDWYRFLAGCRGMIGVESGVSIFDFEGKAREACDAYIEKHPAADFNEVHAAVLQPFEDNLYYRMISPRVFEMAACRVCMILFEGRYTGILKPMIHYIPLKKDFSNFDQVMETISDPAEWQRLTDNAYRDLITSRSYSYQTFMKEFDEELAHLDLGEGMNETEIRQIDRQLRRGEWIRAAWVKKQEQLFQLLRSCLPKDIRNSPVINSLIRCYRAYKWRGQDGHCRDLFNQFKKIL